MKISSVFSFLLSCWISVLFANPWVDSLIGSRESDPATLVENVSTLYGDYSEHVVDIVVSAPDALTFSRYYTSQECSDVETLGQWRFTPHWSLWTLPMRSNQGEMLYVYVGTPEGSIIPYLGYASEESSGRIPLHIDEEDAKSIVNTARGPLHRGSDLRNSTLYFYSQEDRFELHLGSGGLRIYEKNPSSSRSYLLTREILPSGNKIFYERDHRGDVFVRETNAAGNKTLAWMKVRYGRKQIAVDTSDHQHVEYHITHHHRKRYLLTRVLHSHHLPIEYEYDVFEHRPFLAKKILPGGRYVRIRYERNKDKRYKVRTLSLPSDAGESTFVFTYYKGVTQVDGFGSRRTLYRFDQQRLVAIEEHVKGAPYRIHRNRWGERELRGRLLATSLEDGQGHPWYYKRLTYDNQGNLGATYEYGASTTPLQIHPDGSVPHHPGRVTYYTSFNEGSIQGSIRKEEGREEKCWYLPGTNLLSKKYIMTSSGIQERFFYFYDEDALLTKVIHDDSPYPEGDRLHENTERTITLIAPKRELPNLGAPEVIEQRVQRGRSEILLRKTLHRFDHQGRITAQEIYDANNHLYTTLKREYQGYHLSMETDALGNETRYGYDANDNLIVEDFPQQGLTKEYTYDLQNRLVKVIQTGCSGEHLERHIHYDQQGNLQAESDWLGNETLYQHDELGRPTHAIYPPVCEGPHRNVQPTYTYSYDLFDHPVSITDHHGQAFTQSWNAYGQPLVRNHIDGTQERFAYDQGGRLSFHCGRDGISKRFTYDDLDRLTKVESLDRAQGKVFETHSYRYNALHTLEVTDTSHPTFYTYDSAGRLATREKEGRKEEYSYDPLGRCSSIKRWTSLTTFIREVKEYDRVGRILEERSEDHQGVILRKFRYLYTPAGNLAQVIGYPHQKETILEQYEYDSLGRLTLAIKGGYSTRFSYQQVTNEWGRHCLQRTVTDALGVREEILEGDQLCKVSTRDRSGTLLSELELFHDHRGNTLLEQGALNTQDLLKHYSVARTFQGDRLESLTLGKGSSNEQLSQWKYNTYGELITYEVPGHHPITYTYDAQGNLVTRAGDHPSEHYQFQYDRHHLMKAESSGIGVSYAWGSHDTLLSEQVSDAWGSYAVAREVDKEGKITQLVLPDGSYVNYFYEGPYVTKVQRFSKEGIERYDYHAITRDGIGHLLEEALPGSIIQKRLWDEEGHAKGISSELFQEEISKRDLLGNILQRNLTLHQKQYIVEYEYDASHQLISEKGLSPHTYRYDSLGNRLNKDGSSYDVNDINQVIQGGGLTYTYDAKGYLATKEAPSTFWFFGGKRWSYQSNALGQLISVEDSDHKTTAYSYDFQGKRLTKKELSQGKTTQVHRFFYLGGYELGALDERGQVIELKVPIDPNDPVSPALAIELKQTVYVPLYDLQGSIVALVDPSTKKIVESYLYSAYGEIERGKTIVGNPWSYRGKRFDPETGLIYFGYRYYAPELGRWISPDPIGTIDGLNVYSYVHNNPLRYVDDFGLSTRKPCICGHCNTGLPCHCLNRVSEERCLCRNVPCEHKPESYDDDDEDDEDEDDDEDEEKPPAKSEPIPQIFAGMGHGVVDYVLAWMHVLRKGTTYCRVWNLPLQDREAIIAAVEQRDRQYRERVEQYYTNLCEVDPSYIAYYASRRATRIGLEWLSYLGGGYGAWKGIIGGWRRVKAYVETVYVPPGGLRVGKYVYDPKAAKHFEDLVKRGRNRGRLERPFMRSQLTIEEIMAAGDPIPDPRNAPGGWRWDVPGGFREGEGTWELVITPEENYIWHFNYTTGGK